MWDNDINDCNDLVRHYTERLLGQWDGRPVASIVVRNLEPELKERLRVRAARCGHSMEEEARIILRQALGGVTGPELLQKTRELFGPEHGAELELPSRKDDREIPHLDE